MHLSELNIYPIKSLKGIPLTEVTVEKRGLRFDRRWMITDRSGMFFTQREVPKMATVRVAVASDGLCVEADGFEAINIPASPEPPSGQRVTVWHSEVEGLVYNGRVSEWFSDVLGQTCQLVLMPESSERHVSERFDTGRDIVSFADGFPLLLIGEGSLEELNKRIAIGESAEKSDRAPLRMNRFRPNLVVRGSEPFAEDRWAKIRVGGAAFRVVKPCGRCSITTVDQDKGEFDGKEPLRTLATFRMAKDVHPEAFESFGHAPNSVLFGENLIPENPGAAIRVGDEITVTEWRV
jgi:uncharacterized protein YcbX